MQDPEARPGARHATRRRGGAAVSAEIVVVGAGVTGLATAFRLATAGEPPRVLEAVGIGAGASGIQPGGVRQQWSTAINCELARESLAAYQSLGDWLESGLDCGFRRCGYVFLAHSDAALAALAASVRVQRAAGVGSAILTPAEVTDVVPGLVVDTVTGASYCADDGYFDRPQAVVEAFGTAAFAAGATYERRRVLSLEQDGSGWRLATEAGPVLAARLVVAAGAATRDLLAGVGLPIVAEERHLFLSQPVRERLLEPLVISAERRVAAKQLADGRVLASDLSAVGDPDRDGPAWRARLRAVLDELLPRLTYVQFPLLVSGTYDMTPDAQPVLGGIDGLPGLWVAAGFSGHGFKFCSVVGELLAQLATEGRTELDISLFDPLRFQKTDPC